MNQETLSLSDRRLISEAYSLVTEADGTGHGTRTVSSKAIDGALLGAAGGAVAGTLGHFFGRKRKKGSLLGSALGGAAVGGALGGAAGAGLGYFGGSGDTKTTSQSNKSSVGGTARSAAPSGVGPKDAHASVKSDASNGKPSDDAVKPAKSSGDAATRGDGAGRGKQQTTLAQDAKELASAAKDAGIELGTLYGTAKAAPVIGRKLVDAGNALDGKASLPKDAKPAGKLAAPSVKGQTHETPVRHTPRAQGKPTIPKEVQVRTGRPQTWSPPSIPKDTTRAAGGAATKASGKAAEKTAVTTAERLGANILRGAGKTVAKGALPGVMAGFAASNVKKSYDAGKYTDTANEIIGNGAFAIPVVGLPVGVAYNVLAATGLPDAYNDRFVVHGGPKLPERPLTDQDIEDIHSGKYDHPLTKIGDYFGRKFSNPKDQPAPANTGRANPTRKRVGPTVYNADRLGDWTADESVDGNIVEGYLDGRIAPEVSACRSGRLAAKLIRDAVEPHINGRLFDDMSWENVSKVYDILVDDLGLPVDWTVRNDENHHAGYSLDGRSKSWRIETHFVNDYGKRIDLYGDLTAFAAGTVGRPWSQYDMAFSMFPSRE